MNNKQEIAIHWFRRDLRLEDNTALNTALTSGLEVLPIFIFDDEILKHLNQNDARVSFIHLLLSQINAQLSNLGSSLLSIHGNPLDIWKTLIEKYPIKKVFTNKDYEPYAIARDLKIKELLDAHGIELIQVKDQVIFEESEVCKNDAKPYTIYTPYKNKWLEKFNTIDSKPKPLTNSQYFYKCSFDLLSLEEIGFQKSNIEVKEINLNEISNYTDKRDFPSQDATSYLSPHLRFGSVSVRQIIQQTKDLNATFLSELIWREFFMQILFHFPHVTKESFNPKYRNIAWRNNEEEFQRWCEGKTGYPIVDAGMRQLNETGYMHNRVRMVVASFLCKHLLIDWRWGEAYFAEKLLDFELSANNGNWQWAAGTGCDAAPYFRVFNPSSQTLKFDSKLSYIKKWLPELNSFDYPNPMVEHTFARNRAIETYKNSIIV
jgi:deoxyribodipyrimidine photo-lyase